MISSPSQKTLDMPRWPPSPRRTRKPFEQLSSQRPQNAAQPQDGHHPGSRRCTRPSRGSRRCFTFVCCCAGSGDARPGQRNGPQPALQTVKRELDSAHARHNAPHISWSVRAVDRRTGGCPLRRRCQGELQALLRVGDYLRPATPRLCSSSRGRGWVPEPEDVGVIRSLLPNGAREAEKPHIHASLPLPTHALEDE